MADNRIGKDRSKKADRRSGVAPVTLAGAIFLIHLTQCEVR